MDFTLENDDNHSYEMPIDLENLLNKRKRGQKASSRAVMQEIIERNKGFPKNYSYSDHKYTLFQDIMLILEVTRHKTFTFQIFEVFQKDKILRYKSAKSMYQRYTTVLQKVQKNDLQRILKHCLFQGLYGSIQLINQKIEIVVNIDVASDRNESQKQKAFEDEDDELVQVQKIIQFRPNNKQSPILYKISSYRFDKNQSQQLDNQESDQLVEVCRVYGPNNTMGKVFFCSGCNNISPKQNLLPNKPNNELQSFSPQEKIEFKKVIDFYSQISGYDSIVLLDYLDKVSGDMTVLNWFLETKDQRILWNEAEDKALFEQYNVGILSYLINKKGADSVFLRKQYLKMP